MSCGVPDASITILGSTLPTPADAILISGEKG